MTEPKIVRGSMTDGDYVFKMNFEVMAMFWESDGLEGKHERAMSAALAAKPFYENHRPGRGLIFMEQDGQLMLGFLTEEISK